MPFYRGRSADGSDMEEVEGVYVNSRNPNEWSSKPFEMRTFAFINSNKGELPPISFNIY